MVLKLYNTLSRKKEEFKPMQGKEVGLYTCGPTVYNFAHIGNFRAYVFGDLLKRYLKYKGYSVNHVMNLTDVDDKTIRDSQKEGVSLKDFTDRYSKYFFEDLEAMNIDKADVYPRATEHIAEMVDIVKTLLRKGYAYETDDGIYFKIANFKEYGKLAHLKLESLKAGARVKNDEYEKENAQDFALWKFWDEKDGKVFWETELGKGRPGWHIECSAMSMKYLGETFDIHTGGVDLIFPHHENEIAQSEAATGKKFVNYWLHNEHLMVDGKKMSKSAGNFYTLRDILEKGHSARAVRYLLISTHYRQQLNFTFTGLDSAKNTVMKFRDFVQIMKDADGLHDKKIEALIEKAKKNFEKAMDDDLAVSEALAVIFDFMKQINTLLMKGKLSKENAEKVIAAMKEFNSVLGILTFKEEKLDKEIEELVQKREEARKNRNFAVADMIRKELSEKGIILEDTDKGVRWKRA